MSNSEFSGLTPKDPVCGMMVTSESSFRTIYKGRDYAFCSINCLTEFQKNPNKYLKPLLFLDPVCCVSVPSDSEFRTFYKGNEFFFCSRRCLAKFQKEPETYIVATVEYFKCPEHTGVRQAEPGECPQCGMPLTAVRTKWVCPYHPQVLYDKPGACPVSGMALIPEPPGRFYSCDLHPKVKQLEPGKCPKCGMVLRPAWADVCHLHCEELIPTTRHCPRCGMKMELSMHGAGAESSARVYEEVCPKCGLLFIHD